MTSKASKKASTKTKAAPAPDPEEIDAPSAGELIIPGADEELPAPLVQNQISRNTMVKGANVLRTMKDCMNMADFLADAGDVVPKDFKDKPGMCLVLVLQARQFGFNPISMAQSAYVVGGKIGYEAKLYTALVNTHAPLSKRIRYRYAGEYAADSERDTKAGKSQRQPEGTRTCTVVAWLEGEDEPIEYTTPEISRIQPKNSTLWSSDPDRQLAYYALRAFVRRDLPELMLGIFTADELEDGLAAKPVAKQSAGAIEAATRSKPAARDDSDVEDAELVDAPGEPEKAPQMPAERDEPPPAAIAPEKQSAADGGGKAADPSDISAEALEQLHATRNAYQRRLKEAGTRAEAGEAFQWLKGTEGWLHMDEAEQKSHHAEAQARGRELPGETQ